MKPNLLSRQHTMHPGVYQGEVVRVRYHKGVPFVKVKLGSGSRVEGPIKFDWVTPWARIVSPMLGALSDGEGRYGAWFSPKKGDIAVVAFEQGLQSHPVCLGFCARIADMPPEFDNDDYLDKTDEMPDDREDPEDEHPQINMAQMLKTLSLYILLHQKTNHLVLDAAEMDGQEDPRIEFGEGASADGWEVALGRRFVQQFLKHEHSGTGKPTNLDYEDLEDYISEFVFINKEPREVDKPGTSTEGRSAVSLKEITNSIVEFADKFCKFITKADDFMEDPVGTLTDGIEQGLTDAVGDMPEISVSDVVNEVSDFISNLCSNITSKGKDKLNEWAGVDGALGALLSGDETDALQTQIGGLDLSGVVEFTNDGANKLMSMADSAGISDTLDALGSDVLGEALDVGLGAVRDVATDTVGTAVNNLIPDIPFVESALDIASGICEGNLAKTVGGLFSGAVDAINTMTGGLLTPFTDAIKTIGGGLIEGLFSGEGLPSGKELVDMFRAGD